MRMRKEQVKAARRKRCRGEGAGPVSVIIALTTCHAYPRQTLMGVMFVWLRVRRQRQG